jgi:hypothetical protein
MKITIFKTLPGIIPCLFLLAGCFTSLEAPAPGQETGLVRVSVGGSQRTALPDLPELNTLHYALSLTKGAENVSASIARNQSSATVELSPGDWTVTAKGFVSQADSADETKALALGNASVTVTAGSSVPLTIPLSLVKTQTGTGTLHYAALNIADLELDTADLAVVPLSEGGSEALSIDLLEADKDTGDIALKAGYYHLLLSLSKYSPADNRSMRAGKGEVVHIYDNLTTRWEDEIDAYPFYFLPVFGNIEDLLAAIGDAGIATEANPYYVALRGSYTESELGDLFSGIKTGAKYITLDLSDCEIETITTTIPNPQYVVSLILPRSLKTLGTAGDYNNNNVFNGWTTLKSVAFPPASALETLGRYAFATCNALVSADLSGCAALKSTDSAFAGCAVLEEVKLPESLETIGNNTFQNCLKLDSVNLPASLKTIGASAFFGCKVLASINLPASLETIGISAFGQCAALTSIQLPASLKTIGNTAFGSNTLANACQNLNVDFSHCRSLTSIGTNAFRTCKAITSVDLSGCTQLLALDKGNAFQDCTSLTSVKLPVSQGTIGSNTFKGCTALTQFVIYAANPPSLTNVNAFDTTHADLQIKAPAASVAAYKAAANWSSLAAKIFAIEE